MSASDPATRVGIERLSGLAPARWPRAVPAWENRQDTRPDAGLIGEDFCQKSGISTYALSVKRLFVKLLAGAACFTLCVGCSHLRESDEQRAAAAVRPWGAGQPEPQRYPIAEAIAGLLSMIK
jgi:hypothetical protein